MQQGADDVLLVHSIMMGQRRRLQRMFQPVHRKAAAIALEHLQVSENAISEFAIEGVSGGCNLLPIGWRALGHRRKSGAIHLAMIRHVLTPCGAFPRLYQRRPAALVRYTANVPSQCPPSSCSPVTA